MKGFRRGESMLFILKKKKKKKENGSNKKKKKKKQFMNPFCTKWGRRRRT